MDLPGGMEHPIILHLYCHLMELSNDPLAATAAAEGLRTKFPHAGHLIHMASHIDIWGGQYKVETAQSSIALLQCYRVRSLATMLQSREPFDATNKAGAISRRCVVQQVAWLVRPGRMDWDTMTTAAFLERSMFRVRLVCHANTFQHTEHFFCPSGGIGRGFRFVFGPGRIGRQYRRRRRGPSHLEVHRVRFGHM